MCSSTGWRTDFPLVKAEFAKRALAVLRRDDLAPGARLANASRDHFGAFDGVDGVGRAGGARGLPQVRLPGVHRARFARAGLCGEHHPRAGVGEGGSIRRRLAGLAPFDAASVGRINGAVARGGSVGALYRV